MRIEPFGEFKTGQLIPINPEGRFHDYAFVPNPLPPAWAPGESIWPLIAQARASVERLEGAGGILPSPGLLLRPLQRREAIKSNSIEGTYVSPEELLLFEAEQSQVRDPKNERMNDWREVIRYDFALNEGCQRIAAGETIDRKLICDLHRSLLQTARGKDKRPGQLRDRQVYVEAGRRYIPPPPEYVDGLIANLETYLQSRDSDPLVRAFIAHYQFEAIHPFEDGNGRIGRLILSLCIYKWLGHSNAWLYLSEFFDRNRKEYINRLLAVSTSGEWNEWVEFCLHGAIQQADSATATCRRLDELKRKYEQQVGHLSSRMNAILQRLLTNPIIETSQLARELGLSYNTVKRDIQKLVNNGILDELPDSRPRAYCAREFFSIAYDVTDSANAPT